MPRGKTGTGATVARARSGTTTRQLADGIIWQGQWGPYGYEIRTATNNEFGFDVLAYQTNLLGTHGNPQSILGNADQLAQCFGLFMLSKGLLGNIKQPTAMVASGTLANRVVQPVSTGAVTTGGTVRRTRARRQPPINSTAVGAGSVNSNT